MNNRDVQLIALGMSLADPRSRAKFDPAAIQDAELLMAFHALRVEKAEHRKEALRVWFSESLGVDVSEGVAEALAKRLDADARHARARQALHKLVFQMRDTSHERRAAAVTAVQRLLEQVNPEGVP